MFGVKLIKIVKPYKDAEALNVVNSIDLSIILYTSFC